MNKKGQQMTLGTIIAIVLGIAVLVFLIFGFSTGWNNMWEQITKQTSGANTKTVIADCETDCSADEKSAWCNERKTLRYFDGDGNTLKKEGTCDSFVKGKAGEENITPNLGFKECAAFNCSLEVEEKG
jgi:hypothetical protein